MIKVDSLRIQLPVGFAHRAEEISQLLVKRLAGIQQWPAGYLEKVSVLHTMELTETDNQKVADELAVRIQNTVNSE